VDGHCLVTCFWSQITTNHFYLAQKTEHQETSICLFLLLKQLLLGDIVISIETAARQAEERGHTLLDEIRILMVCSLSSFLSGSQVVTIFVTFSWDGLMFIQVHGLLHLLGFDHEISCEAEEEMVIEEERVLSSLGWKEKGLIKSAYDLVQNEVNLSSNPLCYFSLLL
jgi:ssRNA-specific RNase YbeY (16S rRNA maturation enzyme)